MRTQVAGPPQAWPARLSAATTMSAAATAPGTTVSCPLPSSAKPCSSSAPARPVLSSSSYLNFVHVRSDPMPRTTLNEAQIVRAAIALLDEDGLDGLNMRSLGKRLDSAATAVYWHVGSKDNLVRLATDAVWTEITLPDLDGLDWRAAASAAATGLHRMLLDHPWLIQAMATHLLYGPNKARYDEHTLAIYEGAGLGQAAADRASAVVFMFALGTAVGAAATVSLTRRLRRDAGDPEELLRAATAEAAAVAAAHPRLRARLDTAAAEYNAAPDDSFEFGLQALLDGIAKP